MRMEALRARMLGGGKKAETAPAPDEGGDTIDIHRKEEILRNLLDPMESYIMRLQSILIWEKPQQSVGVLIGVNGLFWLATTLRFYYLVGMTGFMVVFLERWNNYIWPEIRVPPPQDQDTEGWTPVYPNLMSVPEISQHLAGWWDFAADYIDGYIALRRTNHTKFFIITMLILCTTATFGHYISGYYIIYFTVMGTMLLPCALYHNVVQHAFEKIQPYISQFEEKFHIKRKKKAKGKRKRGELPRSGADDSDSSSDEIGDFVPPPDPSLSESLEFAAAEPEDSDEEVTGHTPGLLTPALPSLNPSREHSDLELDEELTSTGDLTSGDLTSLAAELSSMPAFDANLEDSLSDLHLPTLEAHHQVEEEEETAVTSEVTSEEQPAVGGEGKRTPDPIQFVSSHFKDDSSEDEEARLGEGLAFPDVQDALSPEPSFSLPPPEAESSTPTTTTTTTTTAETLTQTLAGVITSPLVSQTVSSIMTSTVAGLSTISQSVVAATGYTTPDTTAAAATAPSVDTTDGAGTTTDHDNNAGANLTTSPLQTSADTDTLEAEFEFLDQHDLDSLDIDAEEQAK